MPDDLKEKAPKGLALIIAQKIASKSPETPEKEFDEFEGVASEIMEAFKGGNVSELKDALESFIEMKLNKGA